MSDLEIRSATIDDLPAIVAMLADDPLGAAREGDPGDFQYQIAFLEIISDPQQRLVVGVIGAEIVATLQLTIIPGLSRKGSKRALIEAVRVRHDQRGAGVGRGIIGWAIDEARSNRCVMVQLTTDKSRVEAHRFYESLGFESTHLGMKLAL